MSRVFNVWNLTVYGRLKSDTRISQEITYNNFPLPKLSNEEKSLLRESGIRILEAREKFTGASLADLYGPISMPIELAKVHQENDKIVLKILGLKHNASNEEILSELFSSYKDLSNESLL
jgi:hypothetical protein